MTELIKDSGIYAVNVPRAAFGIEVNKKHQIGYWDGEQNQAKWNIKTLPPGNYSIICCTISASEEDAEKVVETVWGGFAGHIKGYVDYELIGCDIQPLKKATVSLSSLLRSLNLTEPNYLIIKKEMV